MTDYGPTDTSTTSLTSNQFPVSAVWVPNDALRPVGGAAASTDSGGKKYTAALVSITNGNPNGQVTKTNSSPVVLPSNQVAEGTPADAFANPGNTLALLDLLHVFNGTTWDRMRSESALSALAGVQVSEQFLQNAILTAKVFSCSTGTLSAAANMAAEFFVPSTSTKNVLIWSVRFGYSNATQYADVRYITALDANIDGTGTSVASQVINLKGGGAASASGFTFKYNNTVSAPAIASSTEPLDFFATPQNSDIEVLSPGEVRFIPAGTAGGIAVYHNTTAAGKWGMTVRFMEL